MVWGIIPRGAAIETSRYSSGCFLGELEIWLSRCKGERGNRWNVPRPGIRLHVCAGADADVGTGTGTSAGTDTAGTNVVMKIFVQVCFCLDA